MTQEEYEMFWVNLRKESRTGFSDAVRQIVEITPRRRRVRRKK
jgi:hypothetical protein